MGNQENREAMTDYRNLFGETDTPPPSDRMTKTFIERIEARERQKARERERRAEQSESIDRSEQRPSEES